MVVCRASPVRNEAPKAVGAVSAEVAEVGAGVGSAETVDSTGVVPDDVTEVVVDNVVDTEG